jgi:hypothetical protein
MQGDYKNEELFVDLDIPTINNKLKNVSIPFFNAVNGFNVNNTHNMRLHNTIDFSRINRFNGELSRQYPATLPQLLATNNKNKFSLINIDIIDDLASIVKYVDGKSIVDKDN